jgi:SsrA-binding protein
MKELTTNRKARHEYTIIKTFEAGIKLVGSEVKPILKSKADIKNSYVRIIKNEAYLLESYVPNEITTYCASKHEEYRDRKLLLKRKEIDMLLSFLKTNQHTTIIPLKIFYSDSKKIKIEIALAKGKKEYDKRQAIKERDEQRYLR